MKIFIIGPAYPLRGGPAQFNENLCAALLANGHEAAIISYSLQYPNFLFPGSSQFDTSGNAPKDILIHTFINTVNPFSWFKTAKFIRKQKPDFIIFRYWLPFFGPALGTIGRLVKRKSNCKVFALTDNIIPHEKRIGDKLFTKYFVKSCQGFITMSKVVFNDLEKFTSTQNKVYSPHPMYETYGHKVSREEACSKLQLNPMDKYVLFFGLIRHYKGLDILMEAFSDERIKKLKLKLLVAGEFYEDKQNYLNLIDTFQLQESVVLHNHFIPNDEVRYYFCACNLVAQTYRSATNSGVTMVGYYYDKPMLVSNVGGLAEIVPHFKAGYSLPLKVKEISDSIVDYFVNERENTFTKGVMEEKKKYTWDTFIQNILNLYSEINKS